MMIWLVVAANPSEKYDESSVGSMKFPTEWKNNPNVPNHQPEEDLISNSNASTSGKQPKNGFGRGVSSRKWSRFHHAFIFLHLLHFPSLCVIVVHFSIGFLYHFPIFVHDP